jgi:hypothetical protein
MIRTTMLALAALGLPASATAQAAGKSCLTRVEAEGLMTYNMPAMVRGISSKCATVLPATAPLVQAGTVTAARYQPDADKAWPVAKTAFDKVAGVKMSELIGDAGIQKLMETTISTGLASSVKTKDCATIDRILDILQPLPAKNMAMLITAMLELGSQGDKAKAPPFTICEAIAANSAAMPGSK